MTWIQTGSGRAFDLLAPDWREVDFEVDIAEGLARIARYTGHVRAGPYSVAQHSVIGADVMMRDTGDRRAAAAFLLHDAHEAYLGDIATPMMRAIAEACASEVSDKVYGLNAGHFRLALRGMKTRVDEAIHRAAGDPHLHIYAAQVADLDLRMLAAERRQLLVRPPKPWAEEVERAAPARLTERLRVWPWVEAADAFRDRLRRYLPERFGEPVSAPRPRKPSTGATRRPAKALQEA